MYRGQLDDSRPGNGKPPTGRDIRAALDATLAGKPVDPVQRPSAGCNIKWKPGNARWRISASAHERGSRLDPMKMKNKLVFCIVMLGLLSFAGPVARPSLDGHVRHGRVP